MEVAMRPGTAEVAHPRTPMMIIYRPGKLVVISSIFRPEKLLRSKNAETKFGEITVSSGTGSRGIEEQGLMFL
jgi:hypothetical protein